MRKLNIVFLIVALIFLLGFIGGLETSTNIWPPLAGTVICLLVMFFSIFTEEHNDDEIDTEEEDGEE